MLCQCSEVSVDRSWLVKMQKCNVNDYSRDEYSNNNNNNIRRHKSVKCFRLCFIKFVTFCLSPLFSTFFLLLPGEKRISSKIISTCILLLLLFFFFFFCCCLKVNNKFLNAYREKSWFLRSSEDYETVSTFSQDTRNYICTEWQQHPQLKKKKDLSNKSSFIIRLAVYILFKKNEKKKGKIVLYMKASTSLLNLETATVYNCHITCFFPLFFLYPSDTKESKILFISSYFGFIQKVFQNF